MANSTNNTSTTADTPVIVGVRAALRGWFVPPPYSPAPATVQQGRQSLDAGAPPPLWVNSPQGPYSEQRAPINHAVPLLPYQRRTVSLAPTDYARYPMPIALAPKLYEPSGVTSAIPFVPATPPAPGTVLPYASGPTTTADASYSMR